MHIDNSYEDRAEHGTGLWLMVLRDLVCLQSVRFFQQIAEPRHGRTVMRVFIAAISRYERELPRVPNEEGMSVVGYGAPLLIT